MKSYSIQITCLLLLIFMTGCDYLDVVPDNTPKIDNAFLNRQTAEQYLATCYWHIPYGGPAQNPAVLGSAEAIFNTERQNEGMQMAKGFNTSNNPLMNHWSGGRGGRNIFDGIRDCNIFLENVHKVKGVSNLDKERWIAEVKTIKAYLNFYLLRYYGPIPLIRENAPVFEDLENVQLYREPVDDCFNYIIELLDEAIISNALPGRIQATATELGRITLPFAQFLKAKVLVYHASPLFNGNNDYANFLNHEGNPFFNQQNDASRWQSAAEACAMAIASCQENGIRLFLQEDYKTEYTISDSTRINSTLRSAYSLQWNPEIIWANTNILFSYGYQASAQPALQPMDVSTVYSYYAPTINTAEQFYSDKGIPIDEDLTYPYNERYKLRLAEETHEYYIQRGEQTAALNFDREPRYYAFLGFDRGKWYGVGRLENDAETWHVEGKLTEYSSAFDPGNYSATGYWPKKLVHMKSGFLNSQTYSVESYPFPEARFSDLLLLYAEALNESKEQPDAEVYEVIDRIRERAGLEGVVESWGNYARIPSKPGNRIGLREIIHRERLNELAFENAHYWDLRRWKEAPAVLNRPVKGWNVLSDNSTDYYTVKVYFQQKFGLKDYFAPIPESDLIRNPNLKQNPGWN